MTTDPVPVVLYVDDEPANRVVFEQNLADRFMVLSVASGTEALGVLAERPVAVLVCDQRMPGMTGNELLALVKEKYPEVVRMVITAYDDLEAILRAVNEGLVARYVVKPWELDELVELLEWGVQAHRVGLHNGALQMRLLSTERLAALGQVSATVMHDLRQPLTYLTTNIDWLQFLVARRDDLLAAIEHLDEGDRRPTIKSLIEDLPAAVADLESGTRLIGEICATFQRLVRGGPPEEHPTSDPRRAIRHAIAVCGASARQEQVWLGYEGPDLLPTVAVSATSLTRVLINLVENALQALAGVERRGRVHLRATAEGDAVLLEVEDNGPGMPPEVLRQATKPFFTTRPEGTGLGLAQSVRMIEGAGGAVSVASTPPTGTTVTLRLPIVEAPSAAQT